MRKRPFDLQPRWEEKAIEIAQHVSCFRALVVVGISLTMIGCLPTAPAVELQDSGESAPSDTGWEPAGAARAWKYIVLHHTATATGDVTSIDREHRSRTDDQGRPWLGIGYHFLIGNGRGQADGNIEPTFRWREQLPGAHAGNRVYNDTGIGVCLVGDFTREPPTPRQQAAVRRLLAWLSERYQIDRENVLRHRDVAATECPGTLFPEELLNVHPQELSPPR